MSLSTILFEVGIVVIDNENRLIFNKKFEEPVLSYYSIQKGNKGSIMDLIDFLKKHDKTLVNNVKLFEVLSKEDVNVDLMPQKDQDSINLNKLELMSQYQLSRNVKDSIVILQKFAIEYSSLKVKESSERLDLHIIQAVNALDETDEIINTMGTRLREWYGLHFPELDNLLQNISSYAFIVKNSKSRDEIAQQVLIEAGLPEKKIEIILDAASRSRGGQMLDESGKITEAISSELIKLSELRAGLSKNIESSMEVLAPNLKHMLTAVIAARLISKAGGLSRLAVMPSSTIQILGAEKALFRALKTGARPPKHGLLFQHPAIHSAPKWQRGKIARALASKIAIATRIDTYRHSEIDTSLMDKLNKRIESIQKTYVNPPEPRYNDQKFRPFRNNKSQNFHKKVKNTQKRRKFGRRFNN